MEEAQKLDYRVTHDLMMLLESEVKCSICLDIYKDPHATNCGHYFCKECMTNYMKELNYKCNCPLCKKPLSRREMLEAPKLKMIADIFGLILKESQRMQPLSSFSGQGGLRKRKLNEFTDYTQTPTQESSILLKIAKEKSATKSPATKEVIEISSGMEIEKENRNEEQSNQKHNKKGSPTAAFINEFMGRLTEAEDEEEIEVKTPNKYAGGLLKVLQDQNTAEKISPRERTQKKKGKESLGKNICILTSALTSGMNDDIEKFCKTYKAKHNNTFTDTITHLVVLPEKTKGDAIQARRTVKYLLAVVKGIWIVSYKWIVDSIIKGEIQSEEDYEATEDPYAEGAPRYSRLHGGLGTLLRGMIFHVSEMEGPFKSALKKSEMTQIIEKAGGTVVKAANNSNKNIINILIQDTQDDNNPVSMGKKGTTLSHKWVLDSISNHTTLEYKHYFI